MPYKYLQILKYIKLHPKCSTAEIKNFFEGIPIIFYKKYENVDILVIDLIENGYCRGIDVGTINDPYNKANITLTYKGNVTVHPINWIPVLKEFTNIIIKFVK